jgi:hypothetical protein
MSQHASKNGAAGGVPVQTPGRSQFAVGFMVCAAVCAGWYVGVRPLEQKFKEKKAELVALKKELELFDEITKSAPPLNVVIDGLNARGLRTNQATALSGNATRLYDAVHDLAKMNSVRLARIEPSNGRGGAQPTASKGAFKGAEIFGYNLEVSGSFESVSRFIDACEQSLGVSKVVSFHLSPQSVGSTAKDPVVTAVIETSHLKLQIPNVAPSQGTVQADASQEKGT